MRRFLEVCSNIEIVAVRLVVLALTLIALAVALYVEWHHLIGMITSSHL